MKQLPHRLSAAFLAFALLSVTTVFAHAETVDGCPASPDAQDTISLGTAALDEASATRTTPVDGCSVAPDAPGTISLGTAVMDESADFTVLAEMTLHLVVQVEADDAAAVDVPVTADVTLAQRNDSTKLTTSVTLRSEEPEYEALIRSVGVSLKYVNYTESTTPDSGDGFAVRTETPTNYLSGVRDSNQAFAAGQTIAATVTITALALDNGSCSTTPVSASRLVTIR